MHDYHLVKSVIASITEKTGSLKKIKKITRIKLKLGSLKMTSKEHFSHTFVEFSKGTVCEGAQLEIEEVSGDVLIVEKIEAEFRDIAKPQKKPQNR